MLKDERLNQIRIRKAGIKTIAKQTGLPYRTIQDLLRPDRQFEQLRLITVMMLQEKANLPAHDWFYYENGKSAVTWLKDKS